jgi:hypothetical protein
MGFPQISPLRVCWLFLNIVYDHRSMSKRYPILGNVPIGKYLEKSRLPRLAVKFERPQCVHTSFTVVVTLPNCWKYCNIFGNDFRFRKPSGTKFRPLVDCDSDKIFHSCVEQLPRSRKWVHCSILGKIRLELINFWSAINK